MSRKVGFSISESVLYQRTFDLLARRSRTVTYADLSAITGVTEAWIQAFGQGRMTNPSVIRVEKLYNALSSTPLELPDEL